MLSVPQILSEASTRERTTTLRGLLARGEDALGSNCLEAMLDPFALKDRDRGLTHTP